MRGRGAPRAGRAFVPATKARPGGEQACCILLKFLIVSLYCGVADSRGTRLAWRKKPACQSGLRRVREGGCNGLACRGGRCATRRPSGWSVDNSGPFEQGVQAAMIFKPVGQRGPVQRGQGFAGLHKAEMARLQFRRALAGQQGQQGDVV